MKMKLEAFKGSRDNDPNLFARMGISPGEMICTAYCGGVEVEVVGGDLVLHNGVEQKFSEVAKEVAGVQMSSGGGWSVGNPLIPWYFDGTCLADLYRSE